MHASPGAAHVMHVSEGCRQRSVVSRMHLRVLLLLLFRRLPLLFIFNLMLPFIGHILLPILAVLGVITLPIW